jgi:hypothetical protein
MANEITLNVNMSVSKGTLRYTFAPPTASINLTGNAAAGGVQNVSTTTEALSLIDVTTRGLANFLNLSTGTEIEIGAWDGTAFRPFGLLKAGEPAVMRLSAQTGTTQSPVARVTEPTNGTANLQWQVFAD